MLDELPLDPEVLKRALAGELERLESAAVALEKQRERARLEDREKVLLTFSGRFRSQSTRLKSVGEKVLAEEAEQLERAIVAELAATKERLLRLLGPDADRVVARDQPKADKVTEETNAAAATPVPGEPPQEVGGPCLSSPQPQESAPARSAGAIASDVTDLMRECDQLYQGAPNLDIHELEARVNVLAARGRLLQHERPELENRDREPGRTLYHAFGCLHNICKETLNPAGVFVPVLRRGYECDWAEFLEVSLSQLDEIRDDLEARQRAIEEAAVVERRTRQIEETNARLLADLLEQLGEHLALRTDDQLWSEDLRDLVGQCLNFAEPSNPQLLDAVAPVGHLFAQGDAFRALRKHLRNKKGVEFSSDSRGKLPVVSVDSAESGVSPPRPASPYEHFRNALVGRKAVLVGATPREQRRVAIQAFFGLDELEWVDNERGRRADGATLAQRIGNGRFDIVFFLARFSSHGLQDHVKAACKSSGVPFALVERGYGITALCLALEDAGTHGPRVAS